MSGRQRIGVMLLAVVIGQPAVATACAMACDVAPPAVASAHQSCESMASPPTGERMTAATPHDCRAHDATVTPVPATAPERAAFWTMDATLSSAVLHSADPPASSGESIARSPAPLGAAPPAAPLVLRI